MSLTNLEKWRLYMRDVTSPDSFVDMGFYYMINAALQRRVWVQPEHSALFPNLYLILVGAPGIGKGLVLKQVSSFLKYHKLKDIDKSEEELEKERLLYGETIQEAKVSVTESASPNGKINTDIDPLLFPVAAEATTYEALLRAYTKILRTHKLPTGETHQFCNIQGVYLHKSLCFCLEEISSLFQKNANKVADFLLAAYDCGDYTYETLGTRTSGDCGDS